MEILGEIILYPVVVCKASNQNNIPPRSENCNLETAEFSCACFNYGGVDLFQKWLKQIKFRLLLKCTKGYTNSSPLRNVGEGGGGK